MTNDKGQYLCYNKVDGAIVTGNEVGAMHALSSILYGLSILGLQSLRTWILIGLGLGAPYIEANRKENEFSQKHAKSWPITSFI
jgi:hypothetical protein